MTSETPQSINNDGVLDPQNGIHQTPSETPAKTNDDGFVQPYEEKLLADILGDDIQEINAPIIEIGKKTANFVKNSMNLAMLAASQSKSIGDWVENGAYTLTSLYELGLGIHKTIQIIEKKSLREERFKMQAIELKKELVEMMNKETLDNSNYDGGQIKFVKINTQDTLKLQEENFEKATNIYLARYFATYFIDEISYNANKKYVRLYPSINYFEEYFTSDGTLAEKMDYFRKKLVKLKIDTKISTIPDTKTSYLDFLKYILDKDYLHYVKKDRHQEFALKFKLYRAYLKQGEFDEQKCCGDRNEGLKTLSGIVVLPGIYYFYTRVTSELSWRRNILKLKEVMRSYLKVESKLNYVIQKKLAFEKLKYYNELTKSKYGKFLLEVNKAELSYEFKKIENSEKNFDVAFKLFQILSYKGIADRSNYVNFNIQYEKN